MLQLLHSLSITFMSQENYRSIETHFLWEESNFFLIKEVENWYSMVFQQRTVNDAKLRFCPKSLENVDICYEDMELDCGDIWLCPCH